MTIFRIESVNKTLLLVAHETSINFTDNTDGSQVAECLEGLTEDEETTKEFLGTNYYGTKIITEVMIPLLKPSTTRARIVNMFALLGLLRV